MSTVPVLRTITFTQLMKELHLRGMSISQDKLKRAILSGLFPFVDLFGDEEYIIWRKGFDEWVDNHCVVEEVI